MTFIYIWYTLRYFYSLYPNSNVTVSILQVTRLKLRRVKEPTPYYRGGKWFSEVYKPTDTFEPPCPTFQE